MPININALLDKAEDHVRELMAEEGELLPVAILFDEDSNGKVLPFFFPNDKVKAMMAQALRDLCTTVTDITGIITVSEAWEWKIVPPDGKMLSDEEIQAAKTDANRVEIVLLQGQVRGEKPIFRIFDIVRGETGKAVELRRREDQHSGAVLKGRMFGFLPYKVEAEVPAAVN